MIFDTTRREFCTTQTKWYNTGANSLLLLLQYIDRFILQNIIFVGHFFLLL